MSEGGEPIKPKRGFQVDSERSQFSVRGLSSRAQIEVFKDLLAENPEMTLQEAMELIEKKQKGGE